LQSVGIFAGRRAKVDRLTEQHTAEKRAVKKLERRANQPGWSPEKVARRAKKAKRAIRDGR
jgi:hypothetical protein